MTVASVIEVLLVARARYLVAGSHPELPWYRNHVLQSFATIFATSKLILMAVVCMGSSNLSGSAQVSSTGSLNLAAAHFLDVSSSLTLKHGGAVRKEHFSQGQNVAACKFLTIFTPMAGGFAAWVFPGSPILPQAGTAPPALSGPSV